MGVHGLWKLLEPAGKAVALESLQNKILGVDVSIWLHQVLKGFQDSQGSPLPNAHLLGLFHRVCKLLFYRIKPVFVFDGGVPALKKNTIAARKKQKGRAARDAERIREQLLKNLVKHKAVRKVLGEKASRNVVSDSQSRKDENLFELPPILNDLDVAEINSSDSDASIKFEASEGASDSDQDVKYLSPSKVYAMNLDLHTLDVKSENFRALPADVRHDILSDLKETRKQSSWGRLHEMPKESTDFSSFQLDRLLKRRSVQVSLEEAEKEMGGKVLSMAELEDIMNAQGVKLEDDSKSKESQLNAFSRRIASDVATRFLLVSGNSKQTDPTSSDMVEAKVEETKTEILETKVEIKKEYQDDWSSDDDVDKVQKQENPEVKIKQEVPDWSSEDESKLVSEQNLAERYLSEKDSLTQEEIFALIQNEKSHSAPLSQDSPHAPGTSRGSVVSPSTSALAETTVLSSRDDSDNDFDEVPPVQSAPVSSSTEKVVKATKSLVTEQCDKKLERNIDLSQNYKPEDDIFADVFTGRKPVDESHQERKRGVIDDKLDSENGEVEVLKLGRIGNASTVKRKEISLEPKQDQADVKLGTQSIEVIIDKSRNYKPEDDIFADIFPERKSAVETSADDKIVKSKEKSIKVVVDKSQNYKPEEDIFADVFDVQGPEKEITELLLKETKVKSVKDEIIDDLATEKEEQAPSTNKIELQAEIKSLEVPRKLSENKMEKPTESESKENFKEKASDVVSPSDLHVDHLDSGNEELNMLTAADDSSGEEEKTEPKGDTAELAKHVGVSSMSSEELQSLETALGEKHERLMAERGRQERLAASITDQMCAEAQELLRLFGVPYVVAPMEAEAQCAFLDALSLTEGTITDDSDIWLFGGRKVYKNFFNQKKHVLQYTSATIQHYLKLERHHMVLLALLVGSDYTAGLEGVGPVTAMEVLAAFPPGKAGNVAESRDALLEGLRRFRDWWQAGRPQRSLRTQQLKNKVKDVRFYEGFPSVAVVEAYLKPTVDESRETFSWGDLDLQGLREFARMKFGWAQAKADEILLPVAKRVAERKNQRFIDSYFNVMPTFKEGEQKMSKRVKRAVHRMDNEDDEDDEDIDDPESTSSPPKKAKTGQKKTVPKPGTSRRKQRADTINPEEESSQVEAQAMPKRGQKRAASKPGKSSLKPRGGEISSDEESRQVEVQAMPKRGQKRAASKPGTSSQKQPGGEISSDEEGLQVEEQAMEPSACVPSDDEDNEDVRTQKTPPKPQKTRRKRVVSQESSGKERSDIGSSDPGKKRSAVPRKTAVKRPKSKTDEDEDRCEEGSATQDTAPLLAKRSKSSDDGSRSEEGPKPRPRQRTHTGVVRTGVRGPPKKNKPDVDPDLSGSSSTDDRSSSFNIQQKAAGKTNLPAKTTTESKRNRDAEHRPSFDPIPEQVEEEEEEENTMGAVQSTSSAGQNVSQAQTVSEPKPGTSFDNIDSGGPEEEPDEEEEAMLAALYAMDWEDDPWGGFEPPRERIFFGGVRKNPAPRSRRPQPPPPPPSAPQPFDNRGYRPGTRTLERIESRLTHPQLELNSPASHIPQREKDRQQAEESKMRAIKLFKASGAMKTSKLLGEDPSVSKRRAKKKKVAAKVTELNLSEESSDD